MSDKIKNLDNASSKSSDASKQPSQAGSSGSLTQNPQPQSNVQSTTNETNTTQTASGKFGDLPIGKADDPPWDPVTMGRAVNNPKKPVDPTDPAHLDISDDEEKGEPKKP
jgi:hypothetical protein